MGGISGSFDTKQIKKLQKQLNKIQDAGTQAFVEACAKELAARLLAKVIKRTPVGVYNEPVKFTTKDGKVVEFTPHTGKVGGTLRRGWTAKTYEEAKSGSEKNAAAYADSLKIKHTGNLYVVEIVNPVEYASYVENGHRTANHQGWVTGRFMLKMSEEELQKIAPNVLEAKLKKFLSGYIK